MKKIDIKVIIYLGIVILATFFIEVGIFNYRALGEKKQVHVYKNSNKAINKTATETNYVYEISFAAPTYINKMEVYLNQIKDGTFYCDVTYINQFGKECENREVKTAYKELKYSVVSLKKKVNRIQIYIPKDLGENNNVFTKIRLLNRIQINRYRMFFIFTCIIILTLFTKKIWEKLTEEKFFLIVALLMGITMIFSIGVRFVGWDETIHFIKVYNMSFGGDKIRRSEALYDIEDINIFYVNTLEERKLAIAYMDQLDEQNISYEEEEQYPFYFSKRAYIAQALAVKIARMIGMEYHMMFMVGKFGNLLLYIILMYYSIKLASSYKLLITIIALIPTSIFQACTYTYDSVVFACITLGLVLWYNEFTNTTSINWKNTILSIFLIIWGCFSKAVYVPIVLVWLLIAKNKFQSEKDRYIFDLLVVGVFLLMMCTFVLPMLTNTIANNIDFSGDERGGDTGAVGQLFSILCHPFSYMKLLIENIVSFSNFRNLGSITSDNFTVLNLMCLNYGLLGCMEDKYSLLLWPILLGVAFIYCNGEKKASISKATRVILSGIVILIVALIWTALYLSFTPIGESYIDGVQARYYLPIIFLIFIVVKYNLLKIKVEYKKYARVILGTITFILLVGTYNQVLKGVCL